MTPTPPATQASPSPAPSPDLASTQHWMLAAISAPGGLQEGLARAQQAHGWRIEEIVAAPPGISPHSRLDIYAQGYWLRLFACLKADYPALQRLLGEPLFEFFARAYLANHPSRSYSLYDLGSGFARFLRRSQSAAARAASQGQLRFPLELAQIEQACSASLRATGLEGRDYAGVDPAAVLLGGNLEIALPDTTRLIIATHPLSAFQPWLAGDTPNGIAESGTGFIAVARHRFHVAPHALADWQFYFLAAARRQPRPLLHCVRAAARRCHRPIPEILAQLSFWLPSAQAGSLLKLSPPEE